MIVVHCGALPSDFESKQCPTKERHYAASLYAYYSCMHVDARCAGATRFIEDKLAFGAAMVCITCYDQGEHISSIKDKVDIKPKPW